MMDQPTDAELRALLAQLELPEKLAMLAGRSAWETHAVDRLAIPSLRVSINHQTQIPIFQTTFSYNL